MYVINPFVYKDAGCARDGGKALQSESGIEKRKMIAELIAFKCAEEVKGIYRAFMIGGPVVVENRLERLLFHEVRLIAEVGMTLQLTGDDAEATMREGFLAEGELLRLPEDQMLRLVEAKSKGK